MKKARKAGINVISLLLCISIISILSACSIQSPADEASSAVKTPNTETENIKADQTDLTLTIPTLWNDTAIILTNSNVIQPAEESKDTLLFELHEKLAYTKENSMGKVWGLFIYANDAFAKRFGEVDYSEIVGANSYIIGTDKEHIYLLVEPTDVQFLEDDKYSQNQYERLQEESQAVLEEFLRYNQITVNTKCPKSSCFSVSS